MPDVTKRLDLLAKYGILDTPAEPEFDDIAHIAQTVCKTPVALVSLVDENRQWFKARIGFAACETPLDQSVCAHALESDDLLIIGDLTKDPRTKDNPLVTGDLHIRFYAGAPLMTPEGVAIGSLCVIDDVPRPEGLTTEQADTLRALARQTIVVMTLRRAMAGQGVALAEQHVVNVAMLERVLSSEAASDRLREAEALVRKAQEAARVGAFEVDVEANVFLVTSEFCRVFGLPLADSFPADALERLILLSDRGIVASSRATRADGSASHDVEYRIRRQNDGALRWISRRGAFQYGESGEPLRMLGIVQDITERKLIELRAAALIALGDQLRNATTTQQATALASRLLGETLAVSRTGFAVIDQAKNVYVVDNDWAASTAKGLTGTWSIEPFQKTIDRLSGAANLIVPNIAAATWLAADLAAYAELDVQALIKIPFVQQGALVGLLFVHSDTPRIWSTKEVDFTLAVADRTHAAVAKLKAEAHQRVLNEELSHRLKNTLSMVQAIITQTLRGHAERGLIRSLEDRVIALSKAHDILLQESWTAAPLGSVLQNVLDLHGRRADFDLSGPDVMLNPKATLAIALLMHELATNSVKYGSLTVVGGRVAIVWRIEAFGADPTFTLQWSEKGGPPAITPTTKGFGSRLIAMGLAGTGGTKLGYGATGFAAEFKAALRSITAV